MTELRVERAGPALWLTVDRPERRNALSVEVLRGLVGALGEVRDARVVVVAGAGERVFCSGADLAVMAEDRTGLVQHQTRGLVRELIEALAACPVPTVARVHGLCLAGGVALALGCDVVLASAAAEFGLPEVGLGLWPFLVSALLARHVSPKQAMDLMLTGDRIDAGTAYRLGLVSRVLPVDTYAAGVEAYVERLAAAAPLAVRLGKRAFGGVAEMPLRPALEAMQAQLSLLTMSEDAAEGLAAFFAKRPPRWTGR